MRLRCVSFTHIHINDLVRNGLCLTSAQAMQRRVLWLLVRHASCAKLQLFCKTHHAAVLAVVPAPVWRNMPSGVLNACGRNRILSGRITATIAIIVLEITGEYAYLPAIGIAVIVAKAVGDAINEGFYHELIHIKNVPFLADMQDEHFLNQQVTDVMDRPPKFVRRFEHVSVITDLLTTTTHNGFPVVHLEQDSTPDALLGLVLRADLQKLVTGSVQRRWRSEATLL